MRFSLNSPYYHRSLLLITDDSYRLTWPLQISFFFSYCPKLNTVMKCEETYSSIYKDCLPPAEAQTRLIRKDTTTQLINYFCDNNAEALITLINGKFIECVMPRQMEMRFCLKTLFATPKMMVTDDVSMTTNTYCKWVKQEHFENCGCWMMEPNIFIQGLSMTFSPAPQPF